MSYKIPSNWTKDVFCSIAFQALMSNPSAALDIAFDLHDVVQFGFTTARSFGFHFDYVTFAK